MERTTEQYTVLNACGQPRTIMIKRNADGLFSWRLRYQDNPVMPDREHRYTDSWFATVSAAKRSARRFMRTLAQ